MPQEEKTSKEITKTTKIGLRTVTSLLKTRRLVKNHGLQRRNVFRKKILNDWVNGQRLSMSFIFFLNKILKTMKI